MTSVTLVTVDAGGNVPPMLDIARTLVRRGEDVRVLGHERQRARIAETGARFEPLEGRLREDRVREAELARFGQSSGSARHRAHLAGQAHFAERD